MAGIGNNKYIEGCNAVRHYSNALKNIRTMTILQGFAIISASSLVASEGKIGLFSSLIISMAGICLTIILYSLLLNYFTHVRSAMEYVWSIEKKETEIGDGPWVAIEANRKILWDKKWKNVLVSLFSFSNNEKFDFIANKAIFLLIIILLMMQIPLNIIQNA